MEIKEALKNLIDNVAETHPREVWDDTVAAFKQLHDDGYRVKIGLDEDGNRWELNKAFSVVYAVILVAVFGTLLFVAGTSIAIRFVLKWLRLVLTYVLTLIMVVPGLVILSTLLVTNYNGPTKLGKKFGRKVQ